MQPIYRHILLLAAALLICALTACGTDTGAAPTASEGALSLPTPLAFNKNLTVEQVLERAVEAMEDAQSFEAVVSVTTVTADGVISTDRTVRMSSPERIYVYSELDDRVVEAILFDGLRVRRSGESRQGLEPALWERTNLAQPDGFNEVSDVLGKIDRDKPVELGDSDTDYLVTGTTMTLLLYGGIYPGSTRSLEYIQGPFEAHIDPATFAPTSVQYESGWATVDSADPAYRSETLITVAIDFLTFNEPVTVTPPPLEMVVESVDPTATATVAATHAPVPGAISTLTPTPSYPTETPMVLGPAPTATMLPIEPFPTATAAAAPPPVNQMGKTPTPHPVAPPPLFTASPGTPVDEFKAEIAAAPPSDVFELAPGLVLVYQPCSVEPDSDGVITAKLFDLGDPEKPPKSSSYMAFIYIDLSAGTWTSEFPGNTSTMRISDALEDAELMQEVVARADPAVRCV